MSSTPDNSTIFASSSPAPSEAVTFGESSIYASDSDSDEEDVEADRDRERDVKIDINVFGFGEVEDEARDRALYLASGPSAPSLPQRRSDLGTRGMSTRRAMISSRPGFVRGDVRRYSTSSLLLFLFLFSLLILSIHPIRQWIQPSQIPS